MTRVVILLSLISCCLAARDLYGDNIHVQLHGLPNYTLLSYTRTTMLNCNPTDPRLLSIMILNQVISTFIEIIAIPGKHEKNSIPTTSNVPYNFAQEFMNNTYGFGPKCNVFFGGISILIPGGTMKRQNRFKNKLINYLIEHRNSKHIFNIEHTTHKIFVKVPSKLSLSDRTNSEGGSLIYIINSDAF